MLLVVVLLIFVAMPAFGADNPNMPPATVPPNTLTGFMALFLNTIGVAAVLRIGTYVMPQIETRVPWVMPALAAFLGPAIMHLQAALTDALGVAIDLSSLVGAVAPYVGVGTGLAAFLFHTQKRRVETTGARWVARGVNGLKIGVLIVASVALMGCTKDPDVNNNISVKDSPGASVNIATDGSGAGSAPCAGNAVGSGDPSRGSGASGVTQGNNPNCAEQPPPVIVDGELLLKKSIGSGFLPTQ